MNSHKISNHKYEIQHNLIQGIDISFFKCEFPGCDEVYTKKIRLIIHQRKHYGLKPFKCQFCGKKFNEGGNLKIHLRNHNNEKPYKCYIPNCNEEFKFSYLLKRHLKGIHNLDSSTFKCNICALNFSRYNTLLIHLQVHGENSKFKSNSVNNINNVNSTTISNKEDFKILTNYIEKVQNLSQNVNNSNVNSTNDIPKYLFNGIYDNNNNYDNDNDKDKTKDNNKQDYGVLNVKNEIQMTEKIINKKEEEIISHANSNSYKETENSNTGSSCHSKTNNYENKTIRNIKKQILMKYYLEITKILITIKSVTLLGINEKKLIENKIKEIKVFKFLFSLTSFQLNLLSEIILKLKYMIEENL